MNISKYKKNKQELVYEYNPKYISHILELGEEGYGIEFFCGENNIPPRIVQSWAEKDEIFRDALDTMNCKRIKFWEEQYISALKNNDKDSSTMAKNMLNYLYDKIQLTKYEETKKDKKLITNSDDDILKEAKSIALLGDF